MPTVALAPSAKMQFFDSAGNPLTGGLIYTYAAGTSTPKATYTAADGLTANTNPIVLDASGMANIWLDTAAPYKFELRNSSGVVVYTTDNINVGIAAGMVDTAQLADGAVTTPKLDDEAVTLAKTDVPSLRAAFITHVATVADMTAIAKATLSDGVLVTTRGRTSATDGVDGCFQWVAASSDTANTGTIFAADEGGTGRWKRIYVGAINARWFGASPSATAAVNTTAFQAASVVLNALGGGTLYVPPGEYTVGVQTLAGATGLGYSYSAEIFLKAENCTKPVIISGYGVKLKAANGLKFGSFDPVTGAPYNGGSSNTNLDYKANAYIMVYVSGCSAPVAIEGFDLDGNLQNLYLGYSWGDTGRQCNATGIMTNANTGGVTVRDVKSRYHGLDGMMQQHAGLTSASPEYSVLLENCDVDGNGRQGLSWVGGTKLTAINSNFNGTGKTVNSGGGIDSGTPLVSTPAAGIDFEAESSVVRNGHFINCMIGNNAGVGAIADTGDVADVVFDNCRFFGVTNYAIWPRKPGFVFRNCWMNGAWVNAYSHSDAELATKFIGCRFTHNPGYYGGAVYLESGSMIDLGGGDTNVLFDSCHFVPGGNNLGGVGVTAGNAVFRSVVMRQTGGIASGMKGNWEGYNELTFTGAGSNAFGTITKRAGGVVMYNGVAQ